MINKFIIYGVLFIALFAGLLFSIGIPKEFQMVTELLIGISLVFTFLTKHNKGIPLPNLSYLILVFIIIVLFSIVMNQTGLARAGFSLRLLFRFIIFYWAITLCRFDDNSLKRLNVVLLIFLVGQLPIVAYKFTQFGINERTMGGYAVHDGSIATMLPIALIFYLASFYFLYKPKKVLILITIGYVLFSIVSEKRAILFLYPIQFLAIFYFIYVKGTDAALTKKMAAFVVSLFFVALVGSSILYFNETLNPDKKVGGEIDLDYALEYANRYNTGVDGYGNTYGRLATAQRTIEVLADKGVGQILFGIGPGSTTPSALDSDKSRERFQKKMDELKISYGMSSMVRIALEYGLAGVIAFLSMLVILTRMCIKWYRSESDPYWKAFSAGSIGFSLSMIFFAFGYHYTAFWGDTMPALFFYAMAVAYTRYGQIRENGKNQVFALNSPARPAKAHM